MSQMMLLRTTKPNAFTYLSNTHSTNAPNALKMIGKNAQLPLKCILAWGKAEPDNKYCGSRGSQELTKVFHW